VPRARLLQAEHLLRVDRIRSADRAGVALGQVVGIAAPAMPTSLLHRLAVLRPVSIVEIEGNGVCGHHLAVAWSLPSNPERAVADLPVGTQPAPAFVLAASIHIGPEPFGVLLAEM